MTKTRIRAAAADDWPAIWRFMRPIVAAGETFAWERDIAEAEARARWCHEPPGRTFVAVDELGRVVGTAESERNHGGPGAHVATASFMVDTDHQRRGIGRALCAHLLERARADGYRAIQFNAVAETNTPRSHSGAPSASTSSPPSPKRSTTRPRAPSASTSCIGASDAHGALLRRLEHLGLRPGHTTPPSTRAALAGVPPGRARRGLARRRGRAERTHHHARQPARARQERTHLPRPLPRLARTPGLCRHLPRHQRPRQALRDDRNRVHKLKRVPNLGDLQEGRISASHASRCNAAPSGGGDRSRSRVV